MLGERDGGAESTREGAALRRAFLAVVPPPDVLRWTESVADSARRIGGDGAAGLRWTRPDQRHLTLQFLGAVTESVADSLTESITESVRRIAPFTLTLGGGGAFPSARRASVVWLGVSSGAAEARRARGGAVADADDRPFRPHLTLARLQPPRDLRTLVEHLGTGPAGPPFVVDRVVLFDSDTRADGAVHTVRARFPLHA